MAMKLLAVNGTGYLAKVCIICKLLNLFLSQHLFGIRPLHGSGSLQARPTVFCKTKLSWPGQALLVSEMTYYMSSGTKTSTH